MTEIQEKLLKELFTKYGSYIEEYNTKTIYLHAEHPKKIKSTAEIEKRLTNTQENIDLLNHYIEMMNAYRCALVERYNYLCCCNYSNIIRLKREKRNNKVYYFLMEIKRNDETMQEELINNTRYEGKERKNAINDYNFLCAANPGYIYEMDIQKAKWEK